MNNSNVSTNQDLWNETDFNDAELQQLLDEPFEIEKSSNKHGGFDESIGNSWIYPSNLPLRAYQLNIVQKAMFENTLVVLPTGLGKTFIAAVIMYNIYRWFPSGKIIFLAPTRPLVAQQIEACHKVMPFPQRDTIELTGKVPRSRRIELWRSKRVFFATPQVVQSDMTESDDGFPFPYGAIKLIVFDEAHKAKGRYAYSEVVQKQVINNAEFRVLALSATPGRTMEDVAEVVRNLLISHLEVRWDSSPDVLPYIHQRTMKTVVVNLNDEIKRIRDDLLQLIDPYMRQLIDAEVLSGSISKINRNYLIYEQKHFKENCLQQRHPHQASVNSNFATCITLYHALELLERHGLRVFVNYFDQDEEGRTNFVLNANYQLKKMVENLRNRLGPNPLEFSTDIMINGEIGEIPKNLNFGHPKFEEARKCLLEHFENNAEAQAIVFCEYRESVTLMHRLLLQHTPILKPLCFVGQGGSNGSLKPLTQKQQIQVMKDFRSGICNVLIATSVGEEGIDVGEVDLVICFDISTTNPTRFIQRIGRTGRKKNGNVVMLVTEGREQQLLKDVLSQKDYNIQKLLTSYVVKNSLYQHAPRLIPTEFNPQCVQTFVKIDDVIESPKTDSAIDKKKKKVNDKLNKCLKGSQDLRKFFKKVPDLEPEELEIFQKEKDTIGVDTQNRIDESYKQINDYIKSIDLPINNFESQVVQKTFDIKKLRKLNKLLQRTTPLVSESQLTDDVKTQLKSKLISKPGKLFILKRNPNFVRDIFEKYKIINALMESDEDVMGSEERDLRKTYMSIEALFGSQEEIEKFLEETICEEPKDQDIFEEESILDFEIAIKHINKAFEGFEDEGFLCDNFDFIDAKVKAHEAYMKELENSNRIIKYSSQAATNNTPLESEISSQSSNDTSYMDSKYCDQFTQDETKLSMVSTPLGDSKRQNFELLSSNTFNNKCPNSSVLEQLAEVSDCDEDLEKTRSFNFGNYMNKIAKNDSKLDDISNIDNEQSEVISLNSTPDELQIEDNLQMSINTSEKFNNEIQNINIDDFLEPFPEENLKDNNLTCGSQKENRDNNSKVVTDNMQKLNTNSVESPKCTSVDPNNLSSPKNRKIFTKTIETSPSVFDMYMKKIRQRKCSQQEKNICDAAVSPVSNILQSGAANNSFNDESMIVPRRVMNLKKRKVLESESEDENDVTVFNVEDSIDEIRSDNESQIPFPRKLKRRKIEMNDFIENEALVSGPEGSEDEMEHTIGCYLKDSVIISSGDDSDEASRTHMQGVYLNSLKSPVARRGAFKIPAPRNFNDHEHIFSQAIYDEGVSEYIQDSFIASDDDGEMEKGCSKNESLCPLEKAEKILKERRKAKRRNLQEVGVIQKRKRRRVIELVDSSEDEFD